MWPFGERAQLELPDQARRILEIIPARFVDDGCTNAPDSLFGFDLRWACRIHDWEFCTRCHPPGSMTLQAMYDANDRLRRFVGESLPWRWGWIKHVYYAAVVRFAGDYSWDSCGYRPVGASEDQLKKGLCRHGMESPIGML